MTEKTENIWKHWQDALAGREVAISPNEPQCGFYKMRKGRNGPWVPVMIRYDESGILRCRVGNDSSADPHDVWTWCADRPISKHDAKTAFETGRFPGDGPTIGDNSKADTRSLVEQLRDYVHATLDWLKGRKIETKVEADQVANRRAEILRITKLCEAERDAKAAPHRKALDELKAEYKPALDEAEEANWLLRQAATDFARAEEARLERERREKWEREEAAKAKARAALEEQRRQKLESDPIAALTDPAPSMEGLEAADPPNDPVKVSLGGQVGRVSGLRSYWEAEIVDYEKALAHYAQHPDVRALVVKLAKAEIKASKGTAVIPGVRGYQDRRVA